MDIVRGRVGWTRTGELPDFQLLDGDLAPSLELSACEVASEMSVRRDTEP